MPRRAAALVAITVLLAALPGTTAAVAQEQSEPVLSVADVTVQEANRNMVFTVRMDRASDEDVFIYFSTVSGTAITGADFLDPNGMLANPGRTIPAGQRSARVVVRVLDDTLDEDTETFTLQLHTAEGATLPGGVVEATGAITDDGDRSTDLVVESLAAASEGATLTFAVTLLTQKSSTVTVNYRTVNGTAVASRPGRPGDFESASGTLEFLDGSAGTQYVSVNLRRDGIDEEDYETVGLRLTSASGASAPSDAATGLIRDSDATPYLSVSDVEGEEGETFVFTVSLDEPSGRDVTARYATADGDAEAGLDYRATRGVLRFPPGVTTRTVSVRTWNDALLERTTEQFQLEVPSIVNAYYGPGAWGYGTIIDNEVPGEPPDTDPGGNVGGGNDRGRSTVINGNGGDGGDGGDGGGGDNGDGGGPGGDDGDGGDREEAPGAGGSAAVRATIAPRIKALIGDALLQIGAPSVELDLTSALGESGDTYRALAADARVVTAVVSGSRLTLTPKAVGATTVSVSATNRRGTALQSFRVTVATADTGNSPDDSLRVTAVTRTAPTIVSLLDDRTLAVGDPPAVLDVAAAFGGAPEASYRATAGDPRVVTAVISGSNLSLTGLAPGDTTVSVRARNSTGEALQSFGVTVVDGSTEGTTPPGSQ